MKPYLVHVGILLLSVAAAGTARAEQPCLKKAWAALNDSNFGQAIESADECIDQFSPRAFRDQATFEAAHEKQPPTGTVDSSFDKKKVFDRWAVNDVSTAYFVRGQAAEQLLKRTRRPQNKQLALDSYLAATRLSYGRCWDPEGWFWSPAEAAADRLLSLK
jgi:hypothetical protein